MYACMYVLAGVVATLEKGVSMAMYFSGLAGRGGVQTWFGALKDGVSSPRRSLMAWKLPDAPESRSEHDTDTVRWIQGKTFGATRRYSGT
jgi:hypothetical protein